MLPKGGLALGLIKEVEATLNITKSKLNKGDCLYIYSDGVKEAWNKQDEKFGIERLSKLILDSQKKSLSLKEMIKDLEKFTNGRPFEDDVTMVRVIV